MVSISENIDLALRDKHDLSAQKKACNHQKNHLAFASPKRIIYFLFFTQGIFMMKKLFLLFFLTITSSASAEKYLISANRLSQLISDWKSNNRVIVQSPSGMMTITDKAGNVIPHKIVGEGIFSKAENDYYSHTDTPSLEGFINFLTQSESIDGYNQLLQEYEASFEANAASTPAERIELISNNEQNIKTLSTRLGLIYNAYMLLSALNSPMINNNNNNYSRPVKQLNIFIETTNDNLIIIKVNYNWSTLVDFGIKKANAYNGQGFLDLL